MSFRTQLIPKLKKIEDKILKISNSKSQILKNSEQLIFITRICSGFVLEIILLKNKKRA